VRSNRPGRLDFSWRRRNLAGLVVIVSLWAALLAVRTAAPRRWFSGEPPILPSRTAAAAQRIDPNTAGAASLRRLHGIGPVLAAAIVQYRQAHGPTAFSRPEDLTRVRGIGPGIVARIRPFLTFAPSGD